MGFSDRGRAGGFFIHRIAGLRVVVACFTLAAMADALGQRTELPPTATTAATPEGVGVRQGSVGAAAPSGSATQKASVVVARDRLEVRAENSSLNEILRDIAAQTGLTITGGIMDQRVFGTYGPGPAPEVISALLQDTGTNMILRMRSNGGFGELILSPRMGGPTPPGPNAPHDEGANQRTPMPVTAAPSAVPISPVAPVSRYRPPSAARDGRSPVTPDPSGFVSAPTVVPASEPGTTPGPATQTSGVPDPSSPSGYGSGATTPQSPNGVKTPQQIFEELQKMQQQQQKP